VKFDVPRMELSSGAGFSTATELADSLARTTRIPFRTAHQIVGRLASQKERPTIEDLDAVAKQVAGIEPSKMGFGSKMLEKALDSRSNVAVRSAFGGPAPKETTRMAKERMQKVAELESEINEMRNRVDKALDALRQNI
jgi:argininosuccinate lyase